MSVTEETTETTETTGEAGERPPSSERWVFVFLAALIAFNLFIFFGSRESGSRSGSNTPPPPPAPEGSAPGSPPPPSPGASGAVAPPASPPPPPPPSPGASGAVPPPSSPPPPPPPASGGVNVPPGLAGPELILGIVALKGNAEAGLSAQQEAAVTKILAQMEKPQADLQKAAETSMSYLSPKQVEWMRMNRGPAAVTTTDDVEPGMDPVTSQAFRLLQKKAAEAKGTAQTYQHPLRDLHFHDLLNGILKMESQGGELAITADQAKAIMVQVEEGNRARQQENDLFAELFQQLEKGQVEYLTAHPELVKTDVNQLILRYAEMKIKE